MDPAETLARITAAIREDDHAAVEKAALDLRIWLVTGGFAPAITIDDLIDLLTYITTTARCIQAHGRTQSTAQVPS